MMFVRPHVLKMRGYIPGEQPKDNDRIVKLNTNENPYPPSPRVVEAVRRELESGTHPGERLRLYSDPCAQRFREAAAHTVGLDTSCILHGNGSDELLALLLRACIEPGDVVAFPEPTYVLYETLAKAQGARVRAIPFDRDFQPPAQLKSCAAKILFLANPNSPSGTALSTAEIAEIAAAQPETLVVVDEAYAAFAQENAMSLVGEMSNVVLLRTLSKSHSLAGMRLGLLFGDADLVGELNKVKDSYNLDRLAIVAGEASLNDQAWTAANVSRILESRVYLTQELERLGLEVLPSQANFVMARFSSQALARATYDHLHQRAILVRYFDRPDLADALRITVGTHDELMTLISALRAFLSR